MAALTSFARSSSVHWPRPGSISVLRSWGTNFVPRLEDDRAYVGTQVELDVAALLEAPLERLLDDGGRGRASDGLREGVRLRGQRGVGGKRHSVDEAFYIGEREQVKAGDPLREGINELDELRVGNGAVDVPVPLGEFPVEVLATEQDLERPPAADDARQTGRGATPGTAANPTSNCPSTARS